MKLTDLRGILQYIPQFREKTFILAIDGAIVTDENFATLLLDVAVLRSLNIRVVLVHGASAQIKTLADESNTKVSDLDGAGITRRMWHVTIPMLSPVIFFNLVMAIIGALRLYLEEKGDRTEGIELRATIPVNLRPPGTARDRPQQRADDRSHHPCRHQRLRGSHLQLHHQDASGSGASAQGCWYREGLRHA